MPFKLYGLPLDLLKDNPMKPQSYGFCMIRRPLLSRNILEDFHARTSTDPAEFESELRRIFSDPLLLEGLQLASGALYELTHDFVQGKALGGKDKLLATLYKFLIRATSRCTPFGLFAGYFTAQTGESTQILFCQQDPFKIRSRLDMAAQQAIKIKILQNTNLRSHLLFYPNSSLYRTGQSYRYMKRLERQQETSFVLTEVAFEPVLEKILAEAGTGILPVRIKSILLSEKLSARGASQYLSALIDSQMLLSSLELTITGEDYVEHLKTTLSPLKNTQILTAAVQKIQTHLMMNAAAKEVNTSLKNLLKADHPLESTLQTTLGFQTTQARLSRKVLDRLSAQLRRIAPLAARIQNQELADFTSRFYARYAQQPVPLLLALDYEYGIGYGALSQQTQAALPLLNGLANEMTYEKAPEARANDLAGVIYTSVFENKNRTAELTDELLKKHQGPEAADLPPSFYVLGSLHAATQQALDAGDYLFELKGLSGPSASNLLTRFCPGDPGLTRHVGRLIQAELARPDDVIFAEIAHVPSGKAANIVQRPDLGCYQIAYLARGHKEAEKTIRADDLWLSCADGKTLILTSRILRKAIIPTLSSAHNFSAGLPVYRFLCDLANQLTVSLRWDWAGHADAPFLPRVQYDQLILSKASWLLTYAAESQPAQSKTAWWKAVEKKLNTPRYFTAGQGDQTLLIDSESETALSLLSQMLKKEGSVRISESLEKPGEGILQHGGQHFSNEIVIPFFNNTRPAGQTQPNQTQHDAAPCGITRRFSTGSAWLYVKIYCAERLSDLLITQTLAPLLASLQKRRIIKKWFFIRYQDPAPHLRLRFLGTKKDFWTIVLGELHAQLDPLLESGMVQGVQTDTYQRELERYPAQLYEKIESAFHSDSQAVFKGLSELPQDPQLRWQAAVLGTEMLLSDFGLDINARGLLIEKMHQQFAAELDPEGTRRRSMDQNYRDQKHLIARILGPDKAPELFKLSACFKRRSISVARLTQDHVLTDCALQNALCTDLIHLFLNRWFFTQPRQQEFAIYHYLKKYYTSVTKNKIS
jgi:thiopeptide-type bacteriocin biosynthesis protein